MSWPVIRRFGIFALLSIAAGPLLGGCGLLVDALENESNAIVSPPPYDVCDKEDSVCNTALSLHRTLNVFDLHVDSLLSARDLLSASDFSHADVPRLNMGRVALVTFSAPTHTPPCPAHDNCSEFPNLVALLGVASGWHPTTWFDRTERALGMARKLQRFADNSDNKLVLVRSKEDLASLMTRRKAGEQVLGALLSIEGAHALENDPENVERLWDAGFRMVGLVHHYDNEIGGSSTGTNKGGLTPFGREVLMALEAKGALIDLGHASPKLIQDVMDYTDMRKQLGGHPKPVIVSHTGLYAVCDRLRNVDDHSLRRIVQNGGIIGIGFWDYALCLESTRNDGKKQGSDKPPQDSIRVDGNLFAEKIVDAIDHVINVTREVLPDEEFDHVAIGSDFDGWVRTGFDARGYVLVTKALLRRNYEEVSIYKIMGGNVCRFLMQNLPGKEPASALGRCGP